MSEALQTTPESQALSNTMLEMANTLGDGYEWESYYGMSPVNRGIQLGMISEHLAESGVAREAIEQAARLAQQKFADSRSTGIAA